MDQQALISVVIPSYNRKDKLPACIESVLGQSYKNIEVIVVDDASTDGTPALFQRISDPRLRYLRYEENRGACYARNYGARPRQRPISGLSGQRRHLAPGKTGKAACLPFGKRRGHVLLRHEPHLRRRQPLLLPCPWF